MRKGGPKPKTFTDEERELVERMSGYGVPQEEIAASVGGGIDVETMQKHFRQELINGRAKANEKVGRALHMRAMEGDTTAAIWWSKTRMGWRGTKDTDAPTDDKKDDRVIIITAADLERLGITQKSE